MQNSRQKSKIAKAVATVTVFSVATRSLAFLFKTYLARTMGAEVMGLYQMCLSLFFMFSALSASGISTVLSRKTAEAATLDPGNKGYSLLSSALVLGLGIAALTLGGLVLLRPYLGSLLADARAVPLLLIMLPALLSTCIYSLIRSWFWGSKQFTAFSITEMIEEILRILFTLLFVSGAITGLYGAYGLALAFTVSDVIVAIILLVLYFVKGGKLQKPTAMQEIVKPAIPLTSMRVFGSLIGTFLAIMLPARLMMSGLPVGEATAQYGRITGMANPLLLAPNAIISSLAIVLIPEMSASGIKKDNAALNRQIDAGILFSVLVSGLFLVVFASLGEELTTFIFKDAESGRYLQVVAWTLIPMPIHQLVTSSLNSIGMEKETFFTYLISTVFLVASVYYLTPVIGIYSVAVANFITLTICTLGNLYFLNKRVKLSFHFLKGVALVAVFAIPCTLLARNFNRILAPVHPVLGLFVGALAAMVFYALVVWVSGLVDIRGFLKLGATRKKKDKSLVLGSKV